jgi:hypothetical protein
MVETQTHDAGRVKVAPVGADAARLYGAEGKGFAVGGSRNVPRTGRRATDAGHLTGLLDDRPAADG